ncbi:hypothetical protein HJG60_009573 [Phyllostomus discolor]|uniref:Uncharacterized protein n=1 Tax=Phyllostomus discolor TaxID=89673 RepID=A0A833YCH8_9CHIR|nr:hypothetical protein HJG60_009573 [Phyllostomus discolor]
MGLAPCPSPRKDPISCNPSNGGFHTGCARDCGRTCSIRRVRIRAQVSSLAQPHQGWGGGGRGGPAPAGPKEYQSGYPRFSLPIAQTCPLLDRFGKVAALNRGYPQHRDVLFPWQFLSLQISLFLFSLFLFLEKLLYRR